MSVSFVNYVSSEIDKKSGRFSNNNEAIQSLATLAGRQIAANPKKCVFSPPLMKVLNALPEVWKQKIMPLITSEKAAGLAFGEMFDKLPNELKLEVLNGCTFSQWVQLRGYLTPQTLKALDIEVLKKNNIYTVFDRFPGANNDYKLFNHYFTQFVASSSKEQIEELLRLEGNDKIRPTQYVLKGWEKVATKVRDFTQHPLIWVPTTVFLVIQAFKISKNFVRAYNELLFPLADAAAQTYLPRPIYTGVKLVCEHKYKFYFGSWFLSYFLPKPLKPIATILQLPLELPRKLIALPYTAALEAFSWNKKITASIDESQKYRINIGIEKARARWIQDISSMRLAAAA